MTTIGITGTIGAGKGETVSCLARQGFKHYSVGGYLKKELARMGVAIDRGAMVELADRLRREHSTGYIIERMYEEAREAGEDCIIESLRALGEVGFLRDQGQGDFILISVDASLKTRYDRIVKRHSALDHVSFEQFVSDNIREMGSDDPARGNIAGCMKLADFAIRNDGTMEELHGEVGKILKSIEEKRSQSQCVSVGDLFVTSPK